MNRHRTFFIEQACAFNMHAVENESARAKHVEALRLTAEALANELKIPEEDQPEPGTFADGRQARLTAAQARIVELESKHGQIAEMIGQMQQAREACQATIAQQTARIAQLEAELEQATAPKDDPSTDARKTGRARS